MSEYKNGDKVLVEAEVINGNGRGYYYLKIAGIQGLFWIHGCDIHPTPNTNTYEDGLREAWETAKKIAIDGEFWGGAIYGDDLDKIFGTSNLNYIFGDNTAAEAAAKIKAWKAAQQIRVGDVVQKKGGASDGHNGVVVKTYNNLRWVLWEYGDISDYDVDELKKTGRTIDIANLLKQIGGEES